MYSGKKVTTFKERFNMLCSRSGVPDTVHAQGIGVSKQTISMWRLGERSPKDATIRIIAWYFHVNVAWLMGNDVDPERTTDNQLILTEEEELLVRAYRKTDHTHQLIAFEILSDHPLAENEEEEE